MLCKKQAEVINPVDYFMVKVNEAGIIASKTERRAESLERDAVEMKKIEYATRFINKEFRGLITSITNFGVYITLDNTLEGLARYDEMDDYFEVDLKQGKIVGERTHQTFSLGDLVNVIITDANVERRYISFYIKEKVNVDEE